MLTVTMRLIKKSLASVLGTAALASCGGGGSGGGSGSGSDAAVNQAPVAAASISSAAVLNAQTSFDTSGTQDPEGRIASRSWAYGDGQIGSTDAHIYTSTGIFTAVYTVTDDQGAAASKSLAVTVLKCSVAGTQAATLSPYPSVCMQTTKGELVIEVYPAQAPATAANFLNYVDRGFYAGTLFHRVIPGFVVQGGGYLSGLTAKAPTDAAIVLESQNGLKNWQYTLAMARSTAANSATSQFFVNLVDNPSLDYSAAVAGANGYAVFGQVISGTAVIDQIATAPTATVGGFADVPVTDIIIRGAVRMP